MIFWHPYVSFTLWGHARLEARIYRAGLEDSNEVSRMDQAESLQHCLEVQGSSILVAQTGERTWTKADVHRAGLEGGIPGAQLTVAVQSPALDAAPGHERARVRAA